MPVAGATVLLTITVLASGCSLDSAPGQHHAAGGASEAAVAPERSSSVDEVLQKTPPDGWARVIVQLRIPEGPDATRVARIESAQRALLGELAGAPHKVLRSYSVTPALALEASRQALLILRNSPHVLRVDTDELAAPSKTPG
jgi:hypothetical protein